MAKIVYIETTIPSYLVARASRDLVQSARQQITHDWWNNHRKNYELCISQIVLDEAAAGDPTIAQSRLELLASLPLLELTDDVSDLAARILNSSLLPPAAARDAVLIAVSVFNEVDILLTWNCRHIANGAILREMAVLVNQAGYELPVICTPEELMED